MQRVAMAVLTNGYMGHWPNIYITNQNIYKFYALAPLPWNYDGQKSMFRLPYSFFADFWIIRVKKETKL